MIGRLAKQAISSQINVFLCVVSFYMYHSQLGNEARFESGTENNRNNVLEPDLFLTVSEFKETVVLQLNSKLFH